MKIIILVFDKIIIPFVKLYWFIFKPKTQGVKVIVKFNDEILLIKHSYGNKNVWTLPGGSISKNETPEDAAKRECDEEVGIDLKNLKNHNNFLYDGEFKRNTIWVISGSAVNQSFRTNYEIGEARWFNIKNLPSNQSPLLQKFLDLAGYNPL